MGNTPLASPPSPRSLTHTITHRHITMETVCCGFNLSVRELRYLSLTLFLSHSICDRVFKVKRVYCFSIDRDLTSLDL